MKKINKRQFNEIKTFLTLSSIGEVMHSQGLSKDTVSWVDASKSWNDYMDTYNLIREQKESNLRKETIRANDIVYVMPEDLKTIGEKLDEILKEVKRIWN